MPRFFVPSTGFDGDAVTVTGDDAFHMARSLRMAVGDTVTVCDMHGKEHLCRLDSLRDDICRLTVLSTKETEAEPPVDITLYMGYPREAVVELLLPAFLPFNLLKSGLNAALTFLLYRPVVSALKSTGLIDKTKSKNAEKRKTNIGLIILAVAIIITCVLFILSLNGVI